MNADKRWIPLVALTLSAAVCAAVASRFRRRSVRAAHEEQHQTNLKAWENEGGNPAPAAVSPTQA
jgi:hypothetical protein